MSTALKSFIFGFLIVVTGCSNEVPEVSKSETFVLNNVHILTMNDSDIRENQTIIINGDTIVWVGDADSAEIPDGSTIVEGDFYVMPGLAEMHAHIPSSNQEMASIENTLALYLSYGITTIRGMLGDPVHLKLRERAETEDFFSPRILTSGPSFNGNTASDPETTRKMVRDQLEAGYNLLKLHPGITLENFEAMADEANSLGIEFSGHISAGVGLERSLDSGQGTIDHMDRYMEFLADISPEERAENDASIIFFGYDIAPAADRSRMGEAALLTRNAGTWVVPTNTLLDNVFNPDLTPEIMQNWHGMEFMPESTVNGWISFINDIRSSDSYDAEQARTFLDIRDELTRILHEEGAGLLLGADAPQIFNPPGFSTHRELSLIVRAGLTPYEAIGAGTTNVGKYLGEENRVGKVAEGYIADLILLSANPLEAIPFHDNIEGVVYRGTYADRGELDRILEGIRNAAR